MEQIKTSEIGEDSYKSDTEQGEVFGLFKDPSKFQPKIKRTPKRKLPEEDNSIKENKARPRTPSGQIISTSVGQLKNILQANIQKPVTPSCLNRNRLHSDPVVKTSRELLDRGEINTEQLTPCEYLQLSHATNIDIEKVDWAQILSRNSEKMKGALRDASGEKVRSETNNNTGRASSEIASILFQQSEKTFEDVLPARYEDIKEKDGQPKPQIMDIRTVVQMLSELQKGIQEQINTVANKKMSEEDEQHMSILMQRLTICEAKERMMTDTIAGMEDRIRELQNKLEVQDINASKRMVVLANFEGSSKKKILKRQLYAFFEKEMKINIVIEDLYRIGNSNPQDIVIVLLSANHKRDIFAHVKLIKNYTNSKGKKYYFRDFLTQKQNETRKKTQEIININNADPANSEEVTTTMSGKVYVGQRQYVPQVTAPDATKVLRMPMLKLNMLLAIDVKQAKPIKVSDNIFTGYSLCVNDYQTIQDAYMKIRLNHAEARHIVCAWSIPGLPQYEANDYCDDDDHGAGKPVLELMEQNQITNRAIFIVRNVGSKLNADRVPAYIETAKHVIATFPENTMTKQKQYITIDNTRSAPQTYAGAVKSPPNIGGRGGSSRGGARGGRRQSGHLRYRGRGSRGGYAEQKQKRKREDEQQLVAYSPISEEEIEQDTPDATQPMDQEETRHEDVD